VKVIGGLSGPVWIGPSNYTKRALLPTGGHPTADGLGQTIGDNTT
jgi:hypothetical protein